MREAVPHRMAPSGEAVTVSQTVAAGRYLLDGWSFEPKTAKNSQPIAPVAPTVAAVATVAAPGIEYPWSDGIRQLEAMPRPPRKSAEDWDELVNEAVMVSRHWGQRATDLGWEPLDLFGCNPNPFALRLDRNGLVVSLAGFLVPLRIVHMTARHAILHDPNGTVLRHQRGGRSGQVFLWEAYAMFHGP